jgi:hypothetical protein
MKLKYCCYNKKTTLLIALIGVFIGISGLPQSASTQSDSSYEVLGIKVFSFAYPFGLSDSYISSKVFEYGYRAAVGLGTSWTILLVQSRI